MAERTHDRFLGGRLLLAQPAKGHRAGTDAALLAACVDADARGLLYDFGAGVGSAGLAAACLHPDLAVRLVEIDPAMAELARLNAAHNGLADRVRILRADVTGLEKPESPAYAADFVIANPPFYAPGTVRASPHAARRLAHQSKEGSFQAWIAATERVLKAKGVLFIIHRPERLHELVIALSGRFGDVRIKPVHAKANEPAIRLLLRAMKGSRAGFKVLPPLTLHVPGGNFTPEAQRIHRGEGQIDWNL